VQAGRSDVFQLAFLIVALSILSRAGA